MKIFRVRIFSQESFFTSIRTTRAWNPEVSNLIVSISQDGFPEIDKFIEECAKKYQGDELDCRYISSLFASKHESILHCGMYNPMKANTFSMHAWITFKGLEFDLRAMYENYTNFPTVQYDKIQRYKETSSNNLMFKLMDDMQDYQVLVKDERKVKYYK